MKKDYVTCPYCNGPMVDFSTITEPQHLAKLRKVNRVPVGCCNVNCTQQPTWNEIQYYEDKENNDAPWGERKV